jgi:DNA-binding MarR family transcriptional regulator
LVDKREFLVFLTDYGEKFKINLLQVTNDLEKKFTDQVGEIELNRVEFILESFYKQIKASQAKSSGYRSIS